MSKRKCWWCGKKRKTELVTFLKESVDIDRQISCDLVDDDFEDHYVCKRCIYSNGFW